MYHFFNPLLHIGFDTNAHIDDYLSVKEDELLTYQKNELDHSEISTYSYRLKSHIHFVTDSISSIQKQLHKLNTHLNQEDCLPVKSFSLHDITYYSHLNSYSYFLFSYLRYDLFLEKHAFSIFEIDVSTAPKKVKQCALAFSSEDITSLTKYPIDLKLEIEKFDTMQSIEDSKTHLAYCQKLLIDYFDVTEPVALYYIEESLLLKYIGDPLVLLRTIQKKHNDNRVKLSLQSLTLQEIDASLIELIHIERRVVKQEQLRSFFNPDDFTAYTTQLQQTKTRMMSGLGITQEQLDSLMGYLPVDFL